MKISINHHPSEELLLDYATGAMEEAYSLAIATHSALCPACRREIRDMEAIGGMLLDAIEPAQLPGIAMEETMAQLDHVKPEIAPSAPANETTTRPTVLPQPLHQYVGCDIDHLQWRRIGLGAYQFVIPTSETGAAARLLRIPAGRPVPHHTHGGLELTLVLAGAFSDETGEYSRGDLQEADENLRHQPQALPGDDCICLAITDAPLRFSNLPARLLQPILGL